MRTKYSPIIEEGRIGQGHYATRAGELCGKFYLQCPLTAGWLTIIAGHGQAYDLPGTPWDHVSVSLTTRCPVWAEMCWVKHEFFEDEEWVVQYHPAARQYINVHPNVLHLWRPLGVDIPKPPPECV